MLSYDSIASLVEAAEKEGKKSVKSSLPIRLLIWAFRKKKSSQRWTMMSMS